MDVAKRNSAGEAARFGVDRTSCDQRTGGLNDNRLGLAPLFSRPQCRHLAAKPTPRWRVAHSQPSWVDGLRIFAAAALLSRMRVLRHLHRVEYEAEALSQSGRDGGAGRSRHEGGKQR